MIDPDKLRQPRERFCLMKHRFTIFIVFTAASFAFGGCSSMSKVAKDFSAKRKAEGLVHNPDQMRISTENAIFQPIVRVDVPQFTGLQTPLVGGNRLRNNTIPRVINLPQFTAVKVLSNNGRQALVEIKSGERGYVPASCIASESAILATAQPAIPVQPLYGNNMPINPATGLPYDPQALYLPTMDAGDTPVDAAMLNNIDSIPLPESEQSTQQNPEAQYVDGILLRNTNPASDNSTAISH